MIRSRRTFLYSLPCAFALAACGGGDSKAAGNPANTPAAAPTEIRISAIPDFNKGKLEETVGTVVAFLAKATGLKVVYEPSSDYSAAVNGLVANKLDLVWYGGLTTVDAQDAAGKDAELLACRDIDLKFKTYFIANQKAIADGKIKPITDLADLKAMAKTLKFTFGDKKSTSGHLMPRHFLVAAGINPDQDFAGGAAYRASGGHASTMQAVANGEVDLGALNFSYYDKAKPEEKAAAPIVFTTPEYVDYCWVGHQRLGAATLGKIKDAFLKLDPANADDKKVLDAWGAGKFVAADPKAWDSIRQVKNALPKGFLE
ncbi:MAG: phosphate/phosphite/phosphonate ABC transporter substrate-binding protein [Planctomycetes bacterium]|nr:phosphate/phosphite/phosphonate ABC transporter substrate-binding protein [Planctomycetota bacterium]